MSDFTPMPTAIKWVVVALWFEAVSGVAGGTLQVAVGHSLVGEDNGKAALMLAVGYPYVAVHLLLALCAILVRRRLRWLRKTLLVLQVLQIPGLVMLLPAAFVAFTLTSSQGRDWFVEERTVE
ncbi:hypothetical protein [Actinomadura sp. 6N118]|uniref:hypothetical protein n=1 Tax=Actinomadura sp. 6N118 TaxID=3375151 RepID=UPI0037A36C88